jgi:phage I-like protein
VQRHYGSPVLVLAREGNGPPTEFLIFKAGVNESSKGPTLFDAEAAAAVMAVFEREGTDLMIDLNHESLDAPIREDSGDARGWCRLELRAGELWAVDVRWTPDGARRLNEGTQKYTSPAFEQDPKTKRAMRMLNVALVAMPATYYAQPLIAASRVFESGSALDTLSKILQAKISRSSLNK